MARGEPSKKRKPNGPVIPKPCSLPEAEYKPCFVCGLKFNVDSLMRCLVCAGFFHKRCLATITGDTLGCAACQEARIAEKRLQAERNDPEMYPSVTSDTNKHLFEYRMTMMHKFMSAIAAHKAPPKKRGKVPTKSSATPKVCADDDEQTPPPFDPPVQAPAADGASMADVDMGAPAAPLINVPQPSGPMIVARRDASVVDIRSESARTLSPALSADVVPSAPRPSALTLHTAHSEQPSPASLVSPRASLVSLASTVSPIVSTTLVLPKYVLEQTASAVATTSHAAMHLSSTGVGVATEVVHEPGSVMLDECLV
ncbi:hypothetical protein SDRG_05875 [Saprolegnia diclina VS20]|uniref:Uncharacterized protein n=1 Tax=Saprolegnia diclina (strain VS20) TaxID=1156394 RepID=T0RV75_SAPDV|nr:hypothetical protein SDRG_05875 [Saprolegnia diclina VS20]EQC36418.1 hypothetical protein SDRG_05875 [Saprolegnia diclina VS20]|eukprot:XP_008609839.1 hypothetical protein SDRG_05875 [Saprolegnia diclina VS20]